MNTPRTTDWQLAGWRILPALLSIPGFTDATPWPVTVCCMAIFTLATTEAGIALLSGNEERNEQ